MSAPPVNNAAAAATGSAPTAAAANVATPEARATSEANFAACRAPDLQSTLCGDNRISRRYQRAFRSKNLQEKNDVDADTAKIRPIAMGKI
jgi:hypothetical protein